MIREENIEITLWIALVNSNTNNSEKNSRYKITLFWLFNNFWFKKKKIWENVHSAIGENVKPLTTNKR